jgi:hypothetical protein
VTIFPHSLACPSLIALIPQIDTFAIVSSWGSNRVSRKDFIKLLGAGAAAIAFGRFVEGSRLLSPEAKNSDSQLLPTASAQSAGAWTTGPDTTTTPIHAALLHNGKIMYLAGSGFHNSFQMGPFEARVLDINGGSETQYTFSEDLFCVGHCQLPNGNIFLAGGTKDWDTVAGDGRWHGLNAAYEYDVASGTFIKVQNMAHGRWYPTCVTLPDGKVMVSGGFDEYGTTNALTEIYNPTSKTFTKKFDSTSSLTYCVGSDSTLPGAGSPCYGGPNNGVNPYLSLYPRMHLMPSGLLVYCGMARTLRTWNPATGQWRFIGDMIHQGWRHYGTSILLPLNNTSTERGKVLLASGAVSSIVNPTNSAEIIDFNAGTSANPVLRSITSMTYARRYPLPVILPNGKAVIFGGTSVANDTFVKHPEMFDPITETWTILPPAAFDRMYHSVALLLPDGRVWTAGGSYSRTKWQLKTEFFSPGYLMDGSRPTITNVSAIQSYGGTFTITSPDASSISAVSLLRLMSPTHHYDPDQRLLWLSIQSKVGNTLTVASPLNANLAPPGYYMVHILNSNGIPSAGRIVKVLSSSPIVDAKAPTVGITMPSAGANVKGPSSGVTVFVAGVAFDPSGSTSGSGINRVEVKVGSNSFKVATPGSPNDWSTWTVSDVVTTSGPKTVKAVAYDNAGNSSAVSVPVTITFN